MNVDFGLHGESVFGGMLTRGAVIYAWMSQTREKRCWVKDCWLDR